LRNCPKRANAWLFVRWKLCVKAGLVVLKDVPIDIAPSGVIHAEILDQSVVWQGGSEIVAKAVGAGVSIPAHKLNGDAELCRKLLMPLLVREHRPLREKANHLCASAGIRIVGSPKRVGDLLEEPKHGSREVCGAVRRVWMATWV
jgi:hypothetical protein